MSLHEKITNLKDFSFYGHMGVVAELLKKNHNEFTEEELNILRQSFIKVFHWFHNKQEEIRIMTDISKDYRERVVATEKELAKLKKLFKV